jgi:hypothetical protein
MNNLPGAGAHAAEISVIRSHVRAPFRPVPDLKSTFIEVFAPDMLSFPDAVLQAHIQLHRNHWSPRSVELPDYLTNLS